MKRLYFISFLVYLTAVAFSSFGTRGSLVFASIIVILSWYQFNGFKLNREIRNKYFVILILLLCVSTLYATQIDNAEFSMWQVLRSQMWTFISIPLIYSTIKFTKKKSPKDIYFIVSCISIILVYMALSGLIDYLYGTNFSPAYIRVIDEYTGKLRLYLIGIELISPFLPIFLIYKKYLGIIAGLIILLISGGKSAFVSGLIPLIYGWFYMKKNLKNNIVIGITSILFLVVTFNVISDRIAEFSEYGDSRRSDQISDSFKILNKNPINYLWGIGLGTPYSNAYLDSFVSGDVLEDKSALLENSRFDIENGYIYLLVRTGILGIILYVLSIGLSMKKYSVLFWILSLVSWFGGSPSGPSLTIYYISFAFSSVVYCSYLDQRIKS